MISGASVRPFEIAVGDEDLADLFDRVSRTRWPSHILDSGWSYGADIPYLRSLADYWVNGYDWRARERAMNHWPQFMATVDGLDIHFLHIRSGAPDAVPLLLVHGYPSSFLEMSKLIPLLAERDAHGRAYDLVIPSLPGYGFSDWAPAPGFGYRAAAAALTKLMRDHLGYRHFGLHGSDVGGFVIGWIALEDRDGAVIGIHTMQAGTPSAPLNELDPPLDAEERRHVERNMAWEAENGAYAHLQRTRPQSIATAINDSPMGLCGWIVEKLRSWSDCDGDVERRFGRDDILDLVMIYWVSGNAPSAMRSYYERQRADAPRRNGDKIRAPAAVTVPVDRPGQPPQWAPRQFAERIFDIRQWTELPTGGHFTSWEEPEAVATAMRQFFGTLSPP